MKVDTVLPLHDLSAAAAAAERAEALGFDGVTAAEVSSNPFVVLGIAAEHTQRITLSTSIALAFVRSPVTMAYAALDLQRASGNRFVLGLGSQTKWQIERRFGMPWSAPGARMRDYVGAINAVWRAWQDETPLDYQGECYRLDVMTPNHRPPRPVGIPVPRVMMAVVGPKACQAAGEATGGAVIHPFSTAAFVHQSVVPNLEAGAARAGRPLDDFEIAGGGMVATAPTPEALAGVVANVRRQIAYYGHFPEYQKVWAIEGWSALGASLQEYAAADRWPEMPGLITDEVLSRFAAVGTYGEIAERVIERFGSYATRVSLPLPEPGYEDEMARAIQAIQGAGGA